MRSDPLHRPLLAIRRRIPIDRCLAMGANILLIVVPAGLSAVENVPTTRTLLLANGELMTGAIRSDAEFFFVTPTTGGEISIPRSRVAHLAADPAGAYRFRASRVHPADLPGRIQLVEWCLEQRLLPAARFELGELRRAASKRPELRQLESRLQLLSQDAETGRPQVGTAAPPRRLPEHPNPTRIPEAALAEFTRHIQPLLINSCAAATCHGRGSTAPYRLGRPPQGANFSPRLTQRNLIATLQLVNFVAPQQSPLLTVPVRAHGTVPSAVWGPFNESHRAAVASWIEATTGDHPSADPANWSDSPELEDEDSAAAPHRSTFGPGLTRGPGTAEEPTTDPFDPEVFNRAFGDGD